MERARPLVAAKLTRTADERGPLYGSVPPRLSGEQHALETLAPGVRTWLAVTTLPVFAGTRDYSGAQLVLEPDVYGRLPLNASGLLALRGGLGYVLPIAGALGGGQKIGAQNSGSASGLRVHAEFQF